MGKELEFNDELFERITKDVGKGKFQLLSKMLERQPSNSFGLASLDHVLNGGLVHGTMVEFFGPEGGGKTTLGLTFMGNNIKNNSKKASIQDAEQKLDPTLAKMLYVDLTKMPLGQPASAEECFKMIDICLDYYNAGDMLLIDSIAALTPEAHYEGGFDGSSYAGNTKEIARGISLIRDKIGKTGAIIICVNQVREKIGVVYGDPETTPGGHALKHACETRLRVSKGPLIKDGDKVIGQEVNVKVVKSAHSAPYNTVNLELYFGQGFSKEKSLLDFARSCGIITGTGAWLEMGGKKYHGDKELIGYLSTESGYADVLGKVKI